MTLAATMTLLVLAAIAAVSDVTRRRVSNRLNLTIMCSGLAWRLALGGGWSPMVGLGGVAAGLAILLVPFGARWIGAGDVKLLAALGAWLGPADVLWVGLYGLAGGGLLALLLAATAGAAVRRQVTANIKYSVLTLSSPDAPRRDTSLLVPLAVPLAITASVFLLSGRGF